MPMNPRIPGRVRAALAALLLGSALALPAAAHGEGAPGLDLTELLEFAQARSTSTVTGDAKVHRTWVKLARALAKESRRGLADDVKKLSILRKKAESTLAGDLALADLLEEAEEEADEALTGLPQETEEWIDLLAGEKDRAKVASLAIRARTVHIEGRRFTGRKRLALFRRSALGYLKALARADRFVDRAGGPAEPDFPAEGGRIYTVIGTGTAGYTGDGLPARRSALYWVEEVKFGPDGLLYILDWNNHSLRRCEADGTITRVCGALVPGDSEGAPLETQLNHPSAVDFEEDGRIWIAAWHNHKVKVYDPRGAEPVVYTAAGGPAGNSGDGGPGTDARFNLVPGVLRLPDDHPFGGGDLLVTDASNQCVRILQVTSDPVTAVNVAGVTVPTGRVDRVFGTGVRGHDGDGGPASAARLGFSSAQNAESDGRLTLGPDGSVYIVSGVENVVRRVHPDGNISRVAGTGEAGFSGDGGPATAARLRSPADVAVAPDGTVFIADQGNHCVRRVSPGGTITTVAGIPGESGYDGDGGTPSAAHLARPAGLELDAAGNLYICDKANSVVRVLAAADPGGLRVPREPYSLPAPARGVPPSKGPKGTIDTYAGTGNSAFTGDGHPALETDFYWPLDLALDPAFGFLVILDWNNHRLRRIEADGTVRTVVGVGELGDTDGPALTVRLNHPTDAAFHPLTGDLHFSSWHTDKVKRVDVSTNLVETVNKPNGLRTFSGDGGPVSQAEFNLPSSVKFDPAGNMFVADEGNRRIRRVDQSTKVVTTIVGTGAAGFSGDDGPATEATLNLPVGQSAQPAGRIALDSAGTVLYIADTDNHRIRRVDLGTGIITTVAGNGIAARTGDGGPATEASLSSPVDVDCDAAGNLFIADRDNHAIRRVDLATGVITTVAGTGVSGFSGDGGSAAAARLDLPSGILVDRATGRLYIADTFNSVIRVVWE